MEKLSWLEERWAENNLIIGFDVVDNVTHLFETTSWTNCIWNLSLKSYDMFNIFQFLINVISILCQQRSISTAWFKLQWAEIISSEISIYLHSSLKAPCENSIEKFHQCCNAGKGKRQQQQHMPHTKGENGKKIVNENVIPAITISC